MIYNQNGKNSNIRNLGMIMNSQCKNMQAFATILYAFSFCSISYWPFQLWLKEICCNYNVGQYFALARSDHVAVHFRVITILAC